MKPQIYYGSDLPPVLTYNPYNDSDKGIYEVYAVSGKIEQNPDTTYCIYVTLHITCYAGLFSKEFHDIRPLYTLQERYNPNELYDLISGEIYPEVDTWVQTVINVQSNPRQKNTLKDFPNLAQETAVKYFTEGIPNAIEKFKERIKMREESIQENLKRIDEIRKEMKEYKTENFKLGKDIEDFEEQIEQLKIIQSHYNNLTPKP